MFYLFQNQEMYVYVFLFQNEEMYVCVYLFQNEEMYVCIYSHREGDTILFYHEGGVEIGDVDSKASTNKTDCYNYIYIYIYIYCKIINYWQRFIW